MRLGSTFLLALMLSLALSHSVSGESAERWEVVKKYLDKLSGNVTVCTVGDIEELKERGNNNFLYMINWYESLISRINELFELSGLHLRFHLPEDALQALEAPTKYRLSYSQMMTPENEKVQNLKDANDAFWQLKWGMILANSPKSILGQYAEVAGCQIGMLFIANSDPLLNQDNVGAASYDKMCTDYSHLTVITDGPMDHIVVLVAHELGHLLGIRHDGKGAVPNGVSQQSDSDGIAIYDEVRDQCTDPDKYDGMYIMDSVPQSRTKKGFSKCSLATLAYKVYDNATPVSCLPRA